MKLLKLTLLNGYKMLGAGFDINFLTKTRVDKDAPNEDLLELEPDFYYPVETIFVGRNSSGKSTVLQAIWLVLEFMSSGRMRSESFGAGETFSFIALVYHAGYLYRYQGAFKKDNNPQSEFMLIESEELGRSTLKPSYRKDLSNAFFTGVREFVSNAGMDNSFLPRILDRPMSLFLPSGDYGGKLGTFLNVLLSSFSEEAVDKLIRLFDDSVETIRPRREENGKVTGYFFKRFGKEAVVLSEKEVGDHLSEGTSRGVWLYGCSMHLFKSGGHLVIDEIEKSFHKNLIGNLILMFNDPSINVAGASLIYSTHYSELLDQTNRCDNINVLHRQGCVITMSNMAADYKVRTELRYSRQFDENAFDNLLNYDLLMELKEVLREE